MITASQVTRFCIGLGFLLLISCSELESESAANNSNSSPVASAQNIVIDENTSKAIVLTATDSDSDALTFSVVTSSINGTLSGTAPNLTYTPNTNVNGADSFTFKVNDGVADSATATVSMTISPVADVSVSNVSIAEGGSGTSNLTFTLTLDAYEDVASVDYVTSDNTATTSGSDYIAKSGTVTFNSSSVSETLNIVINGDADVESDETFTLTLSNASNLQITNVTATATIINDDVTPRLNDTGITWAGEYSRGNKTANDCATATLSANQDCHQGRDSTHNDDTDGMAGFSFTKLDNAGAPLTDQAQTGHVCVKDKTTGLIWEVKTTSGARSNANTYQWGGLTAIGRDHGSKKGTYYDGWNGLVNFANDTSNANTAVCGFTDWRVPTIEELRSIAHLGKTNPAIDQNYFPNTKIDNGYWSSSPYAYNSSSAWGMVFYYGNDSANIRDGSRYVRLVRGGQ